MGLFIRSDDRVAVSIDEGVNTVWVRRKMSLGIKGRVSDALLSVQNIDNQGHFDGVNVNVGKQNTILLVNNILAWEGPDFRDPNNMPVPCTAQNIEALDPDAEIVDAVLAKINELNTKPAVVEGGKVIDPLPSTTEPSKNGSTGSGPTQTQ